MSLVVFVEGEDAGDPETAAGHPGQGALDALVVAEDQQVGPGPPQPAEGPHRSGQVDHIGHMRIAITQFGFDVALPWFLAEQH